METILVPSCWEAPGCTCGSEHLQQSRESSPRQSSIAAARQRSTQQAARRSPANSPPQCQVCTIGRRGAKCGGAARGASACPPRPRRLPPLAPRRILSCRSPCAVAAAAPFLAPASAALLPRPPLLRRPRSILGQRGQRPAVLGRVVFISPLLSVDAGQAIQPAHVGGIQAPVPGALLQQAQVPAGAQRGQQALGRTYRCWRASAPPAVPLRPALFVFRCGCRCVEMLTAQLRREAAHTAASGRAAALPARRAGRRRPHLPGGARPCRMQRSWGVTNATARCVPWPSYRTTSTSSGLERKGGRCLPVGSGGARVGVGRLYSWARLSCSSR